MKAEIDLAAVRAAISAEPWGALGLAFAAGAWFALVEPRGPIARAITSTLGAIALAALRDATGRRVADGARSWIDARIRPGARVAPSV